MGDGCVDVGGGGYRVKPPKSETWFVVDMDDVYDNICQVARETAGKVISNSVTTDRKEDMFEWLPNDIYKPTLLRCYFASSLTLC